MSILVRKANVQDAPAIARIHVLSWQETYRGIIPQPYLDALDIEARTEDWTTHFKNENAFEIFVGIIDGEICGIAAGSRTREPETGFDGEILLLYVLQIAKGRGLGRLLLQYVCQNLLKNGISNTMLWVLKDNPSRGFYEYFGGKEFSTKTALVGGIELMEIAYGWKDIRAIHTSGDTYSLQELQSH